MIEDDKDDFISYVTRGTFNYLQLQNNGKILIFTAPILINRGTRILLK
jgi:hypothetical protein